MPGGAAADTGPMGASQSRASLDGSRDKPHAYGIAPAGELRSGVVDLSDDRTSVALPFVSTEPAASVGKIPGKKVEA